MPGCSGFRAHWWGPRPRGVTPRWLSTRCNETVVGASARVVSDPARSSIGQDLRLLLLIAWRSDRPELLKTLALALTNSLSSGAALFLLAPIIRSLTTGGPTPSGAGMLGGVTLPTFSLPTLLGLFVLFTTVQAWVSRTAAVTTLRFQQQIVDGLRAQAFSAVLAARWSFVLTQRRSDIVEIVTTGATRTGMAFQQFTSFAVTALIAVVTAMVTVMVAPVLAGAALLGVAALAVVMARTTLGPAYRSGTDFGVQNRRLQSTMTDSMDSLRLVRVHNAAERWNRQLTSAFSVVRGVQLETTRRTSMVSAVFSVGVAVCASALVLLAVRLDVSGPAVVTVLVLVSRLAANVRALNQSAASLANALPAVGDLARLTQNAVSQREGSLLGGSRRSGPDPDPGREATGPLLELRQVTYVHPRSANGVFDVSLTVRRGDVTVLTGPSGAGKSTIADLVLGLLAADDGEIMVDGTVLGEDDLVWWRNRVAYVPQETVLVPGSLRENLVWSAGRSVSDGECWQALDRCTASFARALPEGLDTMMGDRGLRLSGGERQRVALARAMLRNPLLLVLDEATSSLDDVTESAVVAWIGSLVPALTVLVIAHRHTTIAAADHLVRIESGRVVETSRRDIVDERT